MQKFTVFYIGATVMVIGVLAAFLGYEYAVRNDKIEPVTFSENQEDEIADEQENELIESIISEKPEEGVAEVEDNTDQPLILENDPDYVLASINEDKMIQAGFENSAVNMSPFSGVIFSEIDLSDYRDDDHISYDLYENDELAGKINEFIMPDNEIAAELYATVKSKILQKEGFEINETNQYGQSSFFANYSEDTNSVFLVVKLNSRLYTLHYPARNHNKMKNLIQILY
jgi:hypothetical protein